jgi:hypothetical protein
MNSTFQPEAAVHEQGKLRSRRFPLAWLYRLGGGRPAYGGVYSAAGRHLHGVAAAHDSLGYFTVFQSNPLVGLLDLDLLLVIDQIWASSSWWRSTSC